MEQVNRAVDTQQQAGKKAFIVKVQERVCRPGGAWAGSLEEQGSRAGRQG